MDLSSFDLDILEAGLRIGAPTVQAVSRKLDQDQKVVRESFVRLAEEGLVSLDGDSIDYHSPGNLLLTAITATSAELMASSQQGFQQVHAIAARLPSLHRSWSGTTREKDFIEITVVHGDRAPEDVWAQRLKEDPPSKTSAVFRDASAIFTRPYLNPETMASLLEAGCEMRTILSVRDVTTRAHKDRIQAGLDSGIQARMLPDPPSWFWVHDTGLVGLPLAWGDAYPSSFSILQSTVLAASLQALFDTLWDSALDITEGTARSWDTLVALLRDGLTIESAASRLKISVSTARRRLADAHDHYKTQSLLSLGAAWGEDQNRRKGPGHFRAVN